jgi:hypothetical protein
MPGDSNPGDVMGDIPIEPIDIIPFLDKTPGDANPPMNGFDMLSPGNMELIPAIPPVLAFVFFPGFCSSKIREKQ